MKRRFLSVFKLLALCFCLYGIASAQKSDDGKEPEKCPEPIYKLKERMTRKAKIIHADDPTYTKEAWQHKIRGTILLQAVLCADGRVTNIEVLKGLPYGLTENAIETTRRMKFRPAEKDGHPVSIVILREFRVGGDDWHF